MNVQHQTQSDPGSIPAFMQNASDGRNLLQSALHYASLGYSVIPVKRNKKGSYLETWKEFQERRASEIEIRSWWKRWPDAMIGIVTGKISGIAVIDIDSDEGNEALEPYLPENLETPTVKTPRGKHIYFQYDNAFPNKVKVFPGVDTRGDGGFVIAPPSVNEEGKRYEWLIHPDEITPLRMPHGIHTIIYKDMHIHIGGCLSEPRPTTPDHKGHMMFTEGTRDDDLFHVANCMAIGGASEGETSQVIDILASNCEPPFPRQEAILKVESAYSRVSKADRNISAEVRELIMTTTGNIRTTDVYNLLHLTTRQEKKACQMALSRCCRDGLLESVGLGIYRRVESDIEIVDFHSAPTEEFRIKLPLDISDKCIIYPGNVIVAAGEKSAGKTAFLLNIVKENMGQYPIDYMECEMGESELRRRLEAFDGIKLSDWKFRAISRHGDWWDVITGERKIYIIDYMEPPVEQVFKVGEYIKKIHEKLGDGICIIGLQKPKGRDTGRGDTFSMEKARLYLALNYDEQKKMNQIKIVDAKAPRGWENPRGLMRYYKINNGAIYNSISSWAEDTNPSSK